MLEILPQSKGVNIALKASGKISVSDYEAYLPEFDRRVEEVLRFRLLLDWEDLEEWEDEALTVRFAQRLMYQLRCERIAILSDDPRRLDDIKNLQGMLMIRDFRVFPPHERDEAWSWLSE